MYWTIYILVWISTLTSALFIPANKEPTFADLSPALTSQEIQHLEGDPLITEKVIFEIYQRPTEKNDPSNPKNEGTHLGNLTIGLFGLTVPNTAQNFAHLSSETYGFGYKNVIFHRVIENFMIQGGDFERGTGTGGYSIYDKLKFPDENFKISNNKMGRLAMANSGPNTNGAQFFISNKDDLKFLDGKHVVFGQLIAGFDTLIAISKTKVQDARPLQEIYVKDIEVVKLEYQPIKSFMPITQEESPTNDPSFKTFEAVEEPSSYYGYFFVILFLAICFLYYNRWFYKRQYITDIKDTAYF
jgi:peptidyl-prolyl cis-trans isomerase B (cyclophilin B)